MKRNYWNLKNWRVQDWIALTVILIMCLIGSFLITQYDKNLNDKQHAKEREQVQRLIDSRLSQSEQPDQSIPLVNNPSDQPPEQTTEKPTFKDTTANMTDHSTHQHQNSFSTKELNIVTYKYQSGMYKGMTYPEAYEAWKAKRDEIQNRFLASTDKTLQLAQAKIDSADAKLSTILTFFKTMSPEELEIAKSETMKDYPEQADEIESFFNDVANHGTTKSLEEITKDYKFIRESDKLIWTATYKNRSEFDKIVAELNQVDTEKPQRPIFK